jgi:PAS domain S-box-containing protein
LTLYVYYAASIVGYLFTRRTRTGTIEWVSGLVCAAIGGLMLTEPRQIYGVAEPYLAWVGGLLVVSGGGLLLALTLRRRDRAVTFAHLVVGTELLAIGLSHAPVRFVAVTVSLGLLGLGTLVAAFLPHWRRPDSQRPIDLFALVAAATIASCAVVLLVAPSAYSRTASVNLGGLEPWYALGLGVAGLTLLAAELRSFPAGAAHRVACALVGAAFWSFVLLVAIPAKSAVGILYWGGSGLLVPALPWIGPRLRRLNHASLRTRFAFLTASVTALAVLATIALDVHSDESALTDVVLTQQQQVATIIAGDLTTGDPVTSVADLAPRIELAQRSLASSEERIYLVGRDGQVILPDDRSPVTANEALVEAIGTSSGAGAVHYSAEDAEWLAGFAPIGGADLWVATERTALDSVAGVEEAVDYRITLFMIVIAAMLGALAAGPLVAPLRAMSKAAEKLAESTTNDPLPSSGVAEVAHLSAAFAQLRDRLAVRTTERERAEVALREANRNLAALVMASPVGVIGLDPSGAVQEWNPAAARLFGLGRSDVLGRELATLLEDERGRPPRVVELLRGSTFNGVEMRLRTRRQGMTDVAMWSAPLLAEDNSLEGSLVIVADITERKRLDAERKRRLSEEAKLAETETLLDRLSFLADASGDLSSSLDLDSTLQRVAAVAVPKLADWCTVHLLTSSGSIETVARAVADPALESGVKELQQHYHPIAGGLSPGAQALRSGQPVLVSEVTHEWLASTATNAEHLRCLEELAPRSVMGIPLIARGRFLGAMTFASTTPGRAYDAASLALAEALARRCALAIDNARLHRETRDALHSRETFLSIASHELGSPLARMKVHADVLMLAHAHGALDDALLARSLGSIQRATNRLASITQDLLDVARWRGGDLPLQPSRVDLGKVVRQLVAGYQDRVDDKRRLTVRVARGRHPALVDVNRLEQVCENLLDNAFKYSTEGGKVQVEVRSERGGVLLQVRDAGIGLPAGAADIIFEPFGRAANAEQHSVSGMGLGLHICRTIVERHGGRIWAESPGELQGTTMNVWVPGAPA